MKIFIIITAILLVLYAITVALGTYIAKKVMPEQTTKTHFKVISLASIIVYVAIGLTILIRFGMFS
jgi:hypothetical protein